MTLGIRKLLIIAIIGGVFLTANIMIVAAWLQEHGVIDTATGQDLAGWPSWSLPSRSFFC